MALAETEHHILKTFYNGLPENGERVLHIRKLGSATHRISKRQTASEISQCTRALYAKNIGTEKRIAFYATSDYRLWIAEWAALANRSIAVIIPDSFSQPDLLEVLAESNSKLVIVDSIASAKAIAAAKLRLPELAYILCLEGSATAELPILSWEDFIESGSEVADRSGASIRSISPKDTALFFYYKDEKSILQATRYTHGLLYEHSQKIDELLGNSATIHKDELVLSVCPWAHPVGHLVSFYIPILKDAALQIRTDSGDTTVFESRPNVFIGRGVDFDILKQNIIQYVKQLGPGARKELDLALEFGKTKYESGKLNPWQRLGYGLLRQTIFKEVQELLGGRFRLYISVDDTVRYETQLFFETFGIELVELPPEILKI